MTSRERIANILRREPVDRVGVFESFWGDTLKVWQDQGHIREDEDLATHFGHDMSLSWCFNMVADIDFEPEVLEETDETVLTRDGNGAVLRRHKLHASTPEHVDFAVKERAAWNELIKPHLTPSRRRIDVEAYRNVKAENARLERFFCWGGTNVFELMHPVCGHEYMLMGMALDPDWVRDMADTYAQVTIDLMEILFSEEGQPDGIWFFEDMGFKQRPFMSPAMYRELIQPAHKRTFDYCHARGLPVIMHSCGFIEPLRIKKQYGDQLVLFGGMDARNLVANDREAIRCELQEKIPILKEGYGYILHSDHSIPTTVEYETYRFFVDEALRLGTY